MTTLLTISQQYCGNWSVSAPGASKNAVNCALVEFC